MTFITPARVKRVARGVARRAGLGSTTTPLPAAAWDDEYEAGRWAYLHDVQEMAHYMVILGYVLSGAPERHVLDMGCGQGRLAELIELTGTGQYLGIDLSPRAIQEARSLNIGGARFEAADCNHWEPLERFDVVVYNESLYYLTSPLDVLARSTAWLRESGIIVISMYRNSNRRKLWKQINATPQIELVDKTHVRNGRGQAWDVGLYRGGP